MSHGDPAPSRRELLQALLLALCCAVLFLRDGLLPGRALVPYPPEQMDVPRAEAIANGTFDPVAARRGFASGGDKYLQSLCWDRVMHDRFRALEIPRWTRDICGGAPFVPQMAQVYEPINLLLLLWPAEQWYGVWYLLHLVGIGWLAYTFLRRLGIAHAAALLGLVAAELGQWTQCKVHHNVILTAALPLWPMLSAVFDLTAGRFVGVARRRRIAALALWTGISWLSGFAVVSLQVTYLALGFAALRTLQRPRGERLRAALPIAAGLALGALLSFAHMIPVLQASAISARESGWNPGFLAAHGLERAHALAALWPDLLSWPADVFYAQADQPLWDDTRMPWSQLALLRQPLDAGTGAPFQSWVETSFAVGTAPLACGVVALADRRHRVLAALFAAAGLLAFGFATAGGPFLSLARFVPGIASADLRRMLFTVAMALVVLTGLGADAIGRGARRSPALAVLVVAALGSAVSLWWCAGDLPLAVARLIALDAGHPYVQQAHGDPAAIAAAIRGAMHEGELAANADHLRATALRSLCAAAAAAVALFACRGRARTAVLLAATLGELLHAGAGCFVPVPAERVATPPAVVAPVRAAAAPNGERPRLARLAGLAEARVAAWYPSNLPGFHGIEDATGYNPLPARRFEDFFRAIEPDRAGKAGVAFGGGGSGIGAFHDPASLRHPLCDLFGIRFVLTREPVQAGPGLVDRTPPGTGAFRLWERTTTLPRATFVREVDVLPRAADRLAELARPDRDVRNRIVLEAPTAVIPPPRAESPTKLEIVSHTDEKVVLRVNTLVEGYVRLADPYDPGWRATIDGYQTEVFVADHYLRAVYVKPKPNDQEIVFTYDAASVVWPRHASLAALVALLASCWARRRRP